MIINRILGKIEEIWFFSSLGKTHKNKGAIKWGIIGTGYMAHIFSKALAKSKNDIIYAISSRSKSKAENFAKKHGKTQFYGSYEELAQDPLVDVIYIATPVECHYENILLCLRNNKNVLCEKPLCQDASRAKYLYDLAESKGLLLMEGMWSSLLPTYQYAKSIIENHAIGEIIGIRVNFFKRDSFYKKRKSVIFDFGAYAINFIYYFDPFANLIKYNRIEINNTDADWHLEFKSGSKLYQVDISNCFQSLSKAVILCENGSIEFNSQFNRTNIISIYNNLGNLIERKLFSYSSQGFEHEINAVNEYLRSNGTTNNTIPSTITLKTLKTIDQILSNE